METEAGISRAAAALRLAYAVLCLVCVAEMLWQMIPEHRRKLMLMRTADRARRAAGRAAFRAGHQAMGHEISGRGQNYGLPLALSVTRDRAAAVVERMRYR